MHVKTQSRLLAGAAVLIDSGAALAVVPTRRPVWHDRGDGAGAH